jgi:hypothetical protein
MAKTHPNFDEEERTENLETGTYCDPVSTRLDFAQ